MDVDMKETLEASTSREVVDLERLWVDSGLRDLSTASNPFWVSQGVATTLTATTTAVFSSTAVPASWRVYTPYPPGEDPYLASPDEEEAPRREGRLNPARGPKSVQAMTVAQLLKALEQLPPQAVVELEQADGSLLFLGSVEKDDPLEPGEREDVGPAGTPTVMLRSVELEG